jgi:hypothetical protein
VFLSSEIKKTNRYNYVHPLSLAAGMVSVRQATSAHKQAMFSIINPFAVKKFFIYLTTLFSFGKNFQCIYV